MPGPLPPETLAFLFRALSFVLPVPSPYCLALHARPGPARPAAHRTVQRDSIFTELPCVDHSTSFARTLPFPPSPFTLPVGILTGYCCSPCARNIDPRANYIVLFRVHTHQSIHPASGRALFNARQLSWSIVSHSFGNVPKPFSFILFTGSLVIR